jgi:hypothetical protein
MLLSLNNRDDLSKDVLAEHLSFGAAFPPVHRRSMPAMAESRPAHPISHWLPVGRFIQHPVALFLRRCSCITIARVEIFCYSNTQEDGTTRRVRASTTGATSRRRTTRPPDDPRRRPRHPHRPVRLPARSRILLFNRCAPVQAT